MREGTGNFQNGDLLYMATHPIADAIRIGRAKPYDCSYPVMAERPRIPERSKDGEKKSAERIIGYYPSVRACVERVVKLIPLDENDGKVISMREYVDEVEKAFKRVSELKL